jgi:hypothetical protein
VQNLRLQRTHAIRYLSEDLRFSLQNFDAFLEFWYVPSFACR